MSLLKFHRPINGVLLDISGVLKDGTSVIKGSIEAVNKLREAGLLIKLVTNETQETRRSLAQSLASLGFSVEEKDIIPPCPALIRLLIQEKLRPHLLVHPNVMQEFEGIDMTNPNCVVIGDAAENFTYENLNTAFRILMDLENPRLFSLGRGRYYRQDRDLMLDVGVYTAALEFATGVRAEIVGKPQPEFFKSALEDMGVKPEEAVMIGDDIVSDVGGAQDCGLAGVLVRTGKFRPSDEAHPCVKPDAIVDNLAKAAELILQNK
ncbi:phospholysine phosphohistidine inorganic pyrophosphate phosphatase [Anabrus simplex]|uniref:phospholysine phosphohistidine inorganic pyrophosphate phosphatase n=1 Tax=Anabrus simplex TaxID=316456 RepID=UPI0035A2C466